MVYAMITIRLCAWCGKWYDRLVPHGHWCSLECYRKWEEEYR